MNRQLNFVVQTPCLGDAPRIAQIVAPVTQQMLSLSAVVEVLIVGEYSAASCVMSALTVPFASYEIKG